MTHGEKEAFININCFSDLYDFFIARCLQQRNEREREREHAHVQKVYLRSYLHYFIFRHHYTTIL